MQAHALILFLGRILCSACGLWRIIAYESVLAVRDDAEWTCAQLRCDALTCAVSELAHRQRGKALLPCPASVQPSVQP